MAATAKLSRTLRLRITIPDFAARERVPTEFGAQDRQRILYPGIAGADGTITFEVVVSVVPHPADGSVRYRGLFVHGTPTEPYLYLSVRPVGADPGAWRRRFKVRFPILSWAEVEELPETCVLATYVSGERNRTTPLHVYAWTRRDAGAAD